MCSAVLPRPGPRCLGITGEVRISRASLGLKKVFLEPDDALVERSRIYTRAVGSELKGLKAFDGNPKLLGSFADLVAHLNHLADKRDGTKPSEDRTSSRCQSPQPPAEAADASLGSPLRSLVSPVGNANNEFLDR